MEYSKCEAHCRYKDYQEYLSSSLTKWKQEPNKFKMRNLLSLEKNISPWGTSPWHKKTCKEKSKVTNNCIILHLKRLTFPE